METAFRNNDTLRHFDFCDTLMLRRNLDIYEHVRNHYNEQQEDTLYDSKVR